MHITKVHGSYDDYKVELSWSELKAIEGALSANHTGVQADETYARLQFYMARLPGPGEEEDKGDTLEQTQAKGELKAAGDTEKGEIGVEDIPLPGGPGAGEGASEGAGSPEGKPEGGETAEKEGVSRGERGGPREIEPEEIPFPRRAERQFSRRPERRG
jgi:hypothetical protein